MSELLELIERARELQPSIEVAALYVEPEGVYAGRLDVDLWHAERDARLYAGPYPVVAHPPCQRWCALAPLVESLHAERLADPSYKIGADNGCFEAALEAVRSFGGVLEHPAYSLAWPRFNLPSPVRGMWSSSLFDIGWTTEVSQSAYGHPCRKRTWLYYVGDGAPPELDWAEPPVTAQVSAFGWARARERGLTMLDKNLSDPTPPRFRDVLVNLARNARGSDS